MVASPVAADELFRAEERFRRLARVLTTRAAIAQTPKQLIWALNKTKLYRYVPVVPAEKRHGIPLLLVFALMNRPSILDLRPGHSFVEYMVERGYDVYLKRRTHRVQHERKWNRRARCSGDRGQPD